MISKQLHTPATRPATRPIVVLPIGDFGIAAAAYLKELRPSIDIRQECSLSDCLTLASCNPEAIVVCISWRFQPVLFDQLDARSYRTGSPFLTLTLEDSNIVLGPIVVPGEGCCWRCWASRRLQASASPAAEIQRVKYYSDHPSEAPRGYLPSLARLGTAQLARTLNALEDGSAHPGDVISINIQSRQISRGRALGIDNCDRCGLRRNLDARSYHELRLELAFLWNKPSTGLGS